MLIYSKIFDTFAIIVIFGRASMPPGQKIGNNDGITSGYTTIRRSRKYALTAIRLVRDPEPCT